VVSFPIQLSLSWHNESTDQTGNGAIRSECTFIPVFGTVPTTIWAIPEDIIDLQMGANRIRVTASDSGGNRGTAVITVERIDDVVAPTIVSRSPTAGQSDVPINRNVRVTFSEEILFSSLTAERFRLEGSSGTIVDGFRSYDSINNSWTLDPNINLLYSTTYTVTIGGGVEDRWGGNTLGGDVSWSFTTAVNPDITAPQVTRVNPEPGTSCAAPGAGILAQFDEPLDSNSVNDMTFMLDDAVNNPVSGSVTYNGSTAEFSPDLPLTPDTEFQATLTTGIVDTAANPLSMPFSWAFTTAPGVSVGAWSATATLNAPLERRSHSAIWTGTEMIIWGGRAWDPSIGSFTDTKSGGRYNPVTDAWTVTNTIGAASPRTDHSAIWTGNEMIIWGGLLGSGGRYSPGTDSWQAMSEMGAPSGRRNHIAIWTGSEMIIWGGQSAGDAPLDSGGRYDPNTDTWTAMSSVSAPSPRFRAAAVWTGTELIVWGGIDAIAAGQILNDGARYNPASDTWILLPTTDAPPGAFSKVSAIWTGTEMIAWNGGQFPSVDGNGFAIDEPTLRFYDPALDTWRVTTSACEPYIPNGHHAVWTGGRIFVWGAGQGYFFEPVDQNWQAIATGNAPPAQSEDASVWAGDRFILWGGQSPTGLSDSGFVFQE
jgi:N-acetylneuraminic acid mutarotase